MISGPALRVYDAMAELEREHGWPAPLDEVAIRSGLASRSTAMVHAENLVRAGLVEKSPFPRGGYRVKRRKEPDGSH